MGQIEFSAYRMNTQKSKATLTALQSLQGLLQNTEGCFKAHSQNVIQTFSR